MKRISLIIIFLAFGFNAVAQQQQEIIQLDSCNQFASNGQSAFKDIYVRVQQTAQWNMPGTSMEEFFKKFLRQYVQKKAGGRITLSLLINEEGKCCFYRAQPNSNVRPDFKELKRLLDQTAWKPAIQDGRPVKSARVIFLEFDGKNTKTRLLD
jgi:hypothetical protein